ncbi:MAG TPA: hypothetical protein VH307_29330 [Streptosporangiaceae bacterium]|nr:hypothetical protein [Streptosporangiaceae bacterium]
MARPRKVIGWPVRSPPRLAGNAQIITGQAGIRPPQSARPDLGIEKALAPFRWVLPVCAVAVSRRDAKPASVSASHRT